jgi:hypothetical protein
MPTTAWKRTFNARAAYPYADMRRVPWRADDFDADALTETPFRVQRVHAFAFDDLHRLSVELRY